MNLENIKNDITITVSTHNEEGVKIAVETKVNTKMLPETYTELLQRVLSDNINKLNEVIKEH